MRFRDFKFGRLGPILGQFWARDPGRHTSVSYTELEHTVVTAGIKLLFIRVGTRKVIWYVSLLVGPRANFLFNISTDLPVSWCQDTPRSIQGFVQHTSLVKC